MASPMTGDTDVCDRCGEPFFPGQRYFAKPHKRHATCQLLTEEILNHGATLHALHEMHELRDRTPRAKDEP
jgi:hypothetical protein